MKKLFLPIITMASFLSVAKAHDAKKKAWYSEAICAYVLPVANNQKAQLRPIPLRAIYADLIAEAPCELEEVLYRTCDEVIDQYSKKYAIYDTSPRLSTLLSPGDINTHFDMDLDCTAQDIAPASVNNIPVRD